MEKGTVLFHTKFQYTDGNIGEKLIIVLTIPDNTDTSFLICKTTSRNKHNIIYKGCYSDKNIFFITPDESCFNKNTFVQFDKSSLFEIKLDRLFNAHRDGNMNEIGILSDELYYNLIQCIKNSEDVIKKHIDMIDSFLYGEFF